MISLLVSTTTVVSLVYKIVYPEGYSGPVAMCAPVVYTITNLASKLVQK